jgi:hypothetical protein
MNLLPKTAGFVVCALILFYAGCTSTPRISPENEKTIRSYWSLYLKDSPEWEDAKAKWLAMGEPEKKCLVNLLILDVFNMAVRPKPDAAGNPEPGWTRSKNELISLGDLALEPLLDALNRLTDKTVALPYIEALAAIASVSEIEAAFDRSSLDRVSYHSRLVKVLIRLDDPRATKQILNVLKGSKDWQVRATAATVLIGYQGPQFSEVRSALELALRDEDPFVAEKAKASLSALMEGQSK